jgi:hypothetical protein
MSSRRRAAALAVLAGVAILCSASLEAAERRSVLPLDPKTPLHLQPAGGGEPCLLGITGAPTNVGDLFPPDDTYYMKLGLTDCGSCSVVVLSRARIQLEFRTPCTVPVEISVVRAFGTSCLEPDRFQVLHGPVAASLTGEEEGVTDFAVDLPPSWRLEANTFLAVTFTAAVDTCSDEVAPRLAMRAGCDACTAYDVFGDDVCSFGAPAIPLIAAELGECVVTPVLRRSWGATKLRYR